MKQSTIEKLLEQIQQDEKPLPLLDAAKYLDVSKSHLYKLTHKNLITFFKPNGKKIYFLKSDLRTWLLRNRQPTADEIEQKAVDYVTLGVSL